MTRSSLRRALLALAGASVIARPGAAQMKMPGMSGIPGMVPDPLGVSMDRLGSGTTWVPDAVSLPARRFVAGDWNLMMHGFVFLQEDVQGGPRGGSQLG